MTRYQQEALRGGATQDTLASLDTVLGDLSLKSTLTGSVETCLRQVEGISASIRVKTGWSLDLERVHVSVLSSSEFDNVWARAIDARWGVPLPDPYPAVARIGEGGVSKGMSPSSALLYEPSEQRLALDATRVAQLSEGDLRSLLHHELTHAAQHQRHPAFFEHVDGCIRELMAVHYHGADIPGDYRRSRIAALSTTATARLAVLEAHATILQRRYEDDVEIHSSQDISSLERVLHGVAVLIPTSTRLIAQCQGALELMDRAVSKGAASVDDLFQTDGRIDSVLSPRTERLEPR